MRLAHGFVYSREWDLIDVYWKGERITSGDPKSVLRDEQSRGEFRHLVARLLIDDLGIDPDLAADFACECKWPKYGGR